MRVKCETKKMKIKIKFQKQQRVLRPKPNGCQNLKMNYHNKVTGDYAV